MRRDVVRWCVVMCGAARCLLFLLQISEIISIRLPFARNHVVSRRGLPAPAPLGRMHNDFYEASDCGNGVKAKLGLTT